MKLKLEAHTFPASPRHLVAPLARSLPLSLSRYTLLLCRLSALIRSAVSQLRAAFGFTGFVRLPLRDAQSRESVWSSVTADRQSHA